jgi:hypothetical protein
MIVSVGARTSDRVSERLWGTAYSLFGAGLFSLGAHPAGRSNKNRELSSALDCVNIWLARLG